MKQVRAGAAHLLARVSVGALSPGVRLGPRAVGDLGGRRGEGGGTMGQWPGRSNEAEGCGGRRRTGCGGAPGRSRPAQTASCLETRRHRLSNPLPRSPGARGGQDCCIMPQGPGDQPACVRPDPLAHAGRCRARPMMLLPPLANIPCTDICRTGPGLIRGPRPGLLPRRGRPSRCRRPGVVLLLAPVLFSAVAVGEAKPAVPLAKVFEEPVHSNWDRLSAQQVAGCDPIGSTECLLRERL
jgi:hypothetical protein